MRFWLFLCGDGQSEVEICLLPSSIHRPPWPLKNNASSSGRCVHRQILRGRSEEKTVLVRPKSNRRTALLVEMS